MKHNNFFVGFDTFFFCFYNQCSIYSWQFYKDHWVNSLINARFAEEVSWDLAKNIFYPHAFLKKRRGYCNHLRLYVMLSHPKPLDEIQTNLVCELLT